MSQRNQSSRGLGRPEVTSHSEIEQAAFLLFAERGFEGTTLGDIAESVGVGRRTLFRYYRSKNDIPWGQFDDTLASFRRLLGALPPDLSVAEAVHRGILAFNTFPPDARPSHRDRMRLILETPALQAHSMLRYEQWRGVIADFVGERMGLPADGVLPQTAAQVSLAVALTAYEAWLARPDLDLLDLLEESWTSLRSYLGFSL